MPEEISFFLYSNLQYLSQTDFCKLAGGVDWPSLWDCQMQLSLQIAQRVCQHDQFIWICHFHKSRVS